MKRIYVISNEDMNDIKIVKSLEDSCVLIDGVTETVRHEIKKKEDGFLEALLVSLAASLVQPVIFSEVKGISGRGFRKAERWYRRKLLVRTTLSRISIFLIISNMNLESFS